ncbi:hypothetical protein Peur_045887 [Populus x canadensis]
MMTGTVGFLRGGWLQWRTPGYHFWCHGGGGTAAGREEEGAVLIQHSLVDGAGLSQVESEMVVLGSVHGESGGVCYWSFPSGRDVWDFYGQL